MSQFTRPTFDVDDSVPEYQPSAQTFRQKPPSFGSSSSKKDPPKDNKQKQSIFAQRRFNVDDDDLERLQEEFFATNQRPAAQVVRKGAAAPVATTDDSKKTGKKLSLFAQRKLASMEASGMPELEDPNMPALEDPNMPTLEDPNMPALEDPNIPALEDPNMPILENPTVPPVVRNEHGEEYEPVMDPNPEPHVPVTKKMLDLTSMLGQVLGEITEHKVEKVTAPSLPSFPAGKPGREERAGFPKPVHRSEFKKRLEAKRQAKPTATRLEKPPTVVEHNELDENEQRIKEMSQEELDAAREEIMNTLSPESIALLMGGLKKNKTKNTNASSSSSKEEAADDITTGVKETTNNEGEAGKQEKKKVKFKEEEDLIEMKKTYFDDVPLESDKLAWMDARFEKSKGDGDNNVTKEGEEEEGAPSEEERIYRTVRFDLQGNIIDDTADIPRHKGLHHHGDEPDKAGYTLSELFYLSRSQVPSQRALVWTTLSRIIEHAKERTEAPWPSILQVFLGKEHQAAIYIRSALDDRHLNVLSSAIQTLAVLLLDNKDSWDEEVKDIHQFNQFLGHVVHPVLPQGVKTLPRKGLNEKLTELVDRVRQSSGLSNQHDEEEQRDDAALAERDLARGLIKMDILPRLRYLLHLKSSELMQDRVSVERLVRILVRMASAGSDVSEAIMQEEDLLESIIQWGLTDTEWPMMEADDKIAYPSLAAARLLTVLAQAKKSNAEMIVEKATVTLRFLVVSPECASLKQRAYALQLETIRLICVLACYGLIVPTLEDLRESMLIWLRAAIQDPTDECVLMRASTALKLLRSLLYAAADPHRTTPPHAIDWHQPTAYLPAVTAIVRSVSPQSDVYSNAIGYLATWAKYIDLFPPESDTVYEVWKAVTSDKTSAKQSPSYTTQSVLCYIQFIDAYASIHQTKLYADLIQEAKDILASEHVMTMVQGCYNKDLMGRYAFWIWLQHDKSNSKWTDIDGAILECGVAGTSQRGETWLAQAFLHRCLSKYTSTLGHFYFEHSEKEKEVSKALFEHDGRHVDSFMLTGTDMAYSRLDMGAFIMSPIDAVYHLDKSTVAQQCSTDAATIVRETLALSQKLDTDHDITVITLMKVFLIGDREGRNADIEGEREIFWDKGVTDCISSLLQHVCYTSTTLNRLEHAWRRSSEYIRQAQVPFYQFYQAFIAQYAAVSFGHHGFARLLVYLVTLIDTVDYRHLLFSDYRDAIRSIRLGKDEVPMSSSDFKLFTEAGIHWE